MNEGYLPLYRKYRPQKLDDIVGQAHIKRALKNAIELNKIAHAYLFTGPRGTGKTSTARILAKSLNCVNGPTVTPCEECESCKAITNTIPVDVIEIDAASNNKVDDAHEILEKVNYAPVQGKYKIYIIDEVHMLTTSAFNALLKTLEEPPKNVIFILATTESHKVLDTIKSRCQRFDFKRITTNDIIEHLKKVADNEGIKISQGAIALIAKSSAGGMRDSLALLDQVSTMGVDKEIVEDDINSLLGRLSFESLLELTEHITNSDGLSSITALEKIYNDGNEPVQILNNLMLFFKNILISKTCDKKSTEELTGLSEERIDSLENIKTKLEKHQIISLINKTGEYIKEIKNSTTPQMWLEVALIDLSNLTDNTKLAELEQRISRLESGGVVNTSPVITGPIPVSELKSKIGVTANKEPVLNKEVKSAEENIAPLQENIVEKEKESTPIPVVEEKTAELEPIKAEAGIKPEDVKDLNGLWTQILQVLLQDNQSGLSQMKAFTALVQYDENGIVVVGKTPSFTEKLNVPEKRKKMVEAIHTVIGKTDIPIIIRPRTNEDNEIKKIKTPPPKRVVTPPVVENNDITEEEKQALESSENNSVINEDSGLSEQSKMVKQLFDGQIVK